MSCHLLRPASIHCLGTMPSFTLFGGPPINIEYTFAISFFHSCGTTLPLTTKPIIHALESFLFFTLPPHKFTTDTSHISSSFYFSFSAPDHGLTFLLVLPPRGSIISPAYRFGMELSGSVSQPQTTRRDRKHLINIYSCTPEEDGPRSLLHLQL